MLLEYCSMKKKNYPQKYVRVQYVAHKINPLSVHAIFRLSKSDKATYLSSSRKKSCSGGTRTRDTPLTSTHSKCTVYVLCMSTSWAASVAQLVEQLP